MKADTYSWQKYMDNRVRYIKNSFSTKIFVNKFPTNRFPVLTLVEL